MKKENLGYKITDSVASFFTNHKKFVSGLDFKITK